MAASSLGVKTDAKAADVMGGALLKRAQHHLACYGSVDAAGSLVSEMGCYEARQAERGWAVRRKVAPVSLDNV